MTIESIVNDWLDKTTKLLQDNYVNTGRKASGKWGKSLEPFFKQTENKINFGLYGESYTEQLVEGRTPTDPAKRGKLYYVILQWIEDKGISVTNKKTFAYFVAKKIDEQGIKVPNNYNQGDILSNVLTDEYVSSSVNSLKDKFLFEVKETIKIIGKK